MGGAERFERVSVHRRKRRHAFRGRAAGRLRQRDDVRNQWIGRRREEDRPGFESCRAESGPRRKREKARHRSCRRRREAKGPGAPRFVHFGSRNRCRARSQPRHPQGKARRGGCAHEVDRARATTFPIARGPGEDRERKVDTVREHRPIRKGLRADPSAIRGPQETGDRAARPAVARKRGAPGFDLAIRSKASLYLAWIPLFRRGGLFVPTLREFSLGDPVDVLLSLLERPDKIPLRGTVAWINPAPTSGDRPQGIGVHLPDDDNSRMLKKNIEGLLGRVARSSRPTYTL